MLLLSLPTLFYLRLPLHSLSLAVYVVPVCFCDYPYTSLHLIIFPLYSDIT